MRKLIFILCSIILFVGCATEAKYKESMLELEGQNINQIIDLWGFPENQVTSPDGNIVYIYHKITNITTVEPMMGGMFPMYDNSGYLYGSARYGEKTVLYNCSTFVEVDKKNIVQRIMWKGNNCVAK